MKTRLILFVLMLAVMLVPAAKADTIIDFTITGGVTASGVFTLGPLVTVNLMQPYVQPIESMTGTLNGEPITLLNPTFVATGAGTEALWTEDVGPNLFAGPIFTADGSTWGLFDNDTPTSPSGWFTYLWNFNTASYVNPIDFEWNYPPPALTPEPGILISLGMGMLCLAACRRKA